MKIVKNLLISLTIAASVAAPAFASVVQTTAPAGGVSYGGWNQIVISGFTLANGTNKLEALTASGTTWDQGWGGQDPWSNQVGILLSDNGNGLVWQHVGGALHDVSDFSYSASAADLQNFNLALGGLNKNVAHNLTMNMVMAPLGYGGWQLYVSNASFSATSNTVPEPGSIALFGLALAGFAAARRKMVK